MRGLITALSFGGMILFLLGFYFAGAYGVPRRYATEPAPGPFMAQFATVGAAIMIIGFILAFIEGLRLRRNYSAERPPWPEDLKGDAP
jgi:heme/copper-type cytochrome/quinol oxidase subunit 1